jgi:hypothetical protein
MVHTFIFLLLFSQTVYGQRKEPTTSQLYSAVINEHLDDTSRVVIIVNKFIVERHSKALVDAIKRRDHSSVSSQTYYQSLDSLTLQLITRYYDSQKKGGRLPKKFLTKVRTQLVGKSQISRLFKASPHDGWRNYYLKYPYSAGIYYFSKVYLSQDGNTAIFYYSIRKAALDGEGVLIVLKKETGIWQKKYEISLWQA